MAGDLTIRNDDKIWGIPKTTFVTTGPEKAVS